MENNNSGLNKPKLPFQTSHAFVIGINDYLHLDKLNTAVNDAKKISEVLTRDQGFKVQRLLLNATHKEIKTMLEFDMKGLVGKEDRVLFYFAGHGVAVDGEKGPEGYIIPADADYYDKSKYMSMRDLHSTFAELPCKHFLLILDCCFAGSFKWASHHRHIATLLPKIIYLQRFHRYVSDPAWQVITSSAADQRALDVLNPLGKRDTSSMLHSPFAMALFNGLSGEADLVPQGKGDGVITAAELYVYLRQQVEPKTMDFCLSLRQTPGIFHLSKHDKGEYIFLNPGHKLNLPSVPDRNPYKGLHSFEKSDEDLFYGRDQAINDLKQKIQKNNLLVVTGASGTGKSSLVKAGLIPEMRNQGYRILPIMRPGNKPVFTLEQLLSNSIFIDSRASLTNDIELEEISRELRRVKTVLVIDQYEELITQCNKEDERDQFLKILSVMLATTKNNLFKVVITLRADFQSHFINSYLKPFWQKARYVVSPFATSELREIIVQPAVQEVLSFEPETLVNRIINEVIQAPGPLPLLSFTLSELFRLSVEKNRQRTLHEDDYDELGGVIGALRQQANKVYKTLKETQKRTMQHIMLRMISFEGGELTGKKVMMDDLIYNSVNKNKQVAFVVTKLANARLIVRDTDNNNMSFIELAHDALIKSWVKLWEWINSFGESNIFLQNRLNLATKDWLQKPQYKFTKNLTSELLKKNVPPTLLKKLEILKTSSFSNHDQLKKVLISTIGMSSTDKYIQIILNLSKVKKMRYDPFLWDDDPRLDSLIEISNSKHHSFNKKEMEFIIESKKIKRNKIKRRRVTVSSIITVLTVLATIAIFMAVEAKNEARIAMANDYTSKAQLKLKEDPTIAIRYAEKAYHLYKKEKTNTVLQILSAAAASTIEHPFYSVSMTHKKQVKKAVFSPSGDFLLTISFEKTARLWTLDGRMKIEINRPTGIIIDGSFSPDGKNILLISNDKVATLWNLKSKHLATFIGHTGMIVSANFSPDGKYILTASRDNTAKLWNLQGKQIANMQHSKDVKQAEFSSDGTRILTNSDNILMLWDLDGNSLLEIEHIQFASFSPKNNQILTFSLFNDINIIDFTNKQIFKAKKKSETPCLATYSPDGSKILIVYLNSDLTLWQPKDNTYIHFNKQHHTKPINSAVFSPDGYFILTASNDKTARIWNLQGKEVLNLYRHSDFVNSAVFSPGGRKILTASSDRTAKIWNLKDMPTVDLNLHKDKVTCGQFSPDGTKVITASHDGTARLWNLNGKQLVKFSKHSNIINSTYFSPDGNKILTASVDQTAKLWDLEGRCLIDFKGHTANVNSAFFSHDGQRIISASYDGSAKLWNLHGKCLNTFNHTKNVTSARFSPDGLMILTTSYDETVRLWDIRGDLILNFKEHFSYVNSAVFSPDGTRILSASMDNSAKLCNLKDKTYINLKHKNGVSSALFSPDGTKILTASHDKTAILWDLQGNLLKKFNRHKGAICSAVFSPDGKRILTASMDNTVKLWALNGELLADYDKHRDKVHKAVFSSDSNRILSVSSDGTGKLWYTPEMIISWLKTAPIAFLPIEPNKKNYKK